MVTVTGQHRDVAEGSRVQPKMSLLLFSENDTCLNKSRACIERSPFEAFKLLDSSEKGKAKMYGSRIGLSPRNRGTWRNG